MFSLSQSLIYLPSIVGIFLIALFVVTRGRQMAFRLFFGFTSCFGLWLLFEYFIDSRVGPGRLLVQMSSVATIVAVALFVWFCSIYPAARRLSVKTLLAIALPALVVIPLSFTTLVVRKVSYTHAGVVFEPGSLYILETILLAGYIVTGLAILRRKLKHIDIAGRMQIYSLMVAFAIGLAGSLVAGIFVNHAYGQIFRPISLLIMVCLIAYAMIFQKLFDIRSYAVRAVAYALTLGIVTGVYVAISLLFANTLLHIKLSTSAIVYLAITMGITAFLFQPIRKYFNKLTNRVFLRDYYDPQDVLDQLSGLLVGTVDIGQIVTRSEEILNASVRPSAIRFLLVNHTQGEENKKLALDLLALDVGLIATDALDHTHYAALRNELRRHDVALAARLRTAHEDLGFILLGGRRSGAAYTSADQRLLSAAADELAVGLQNALRFQEIQNFNATLQERVTEATHNLRRVNDKLRKLNETKDDFISMASHQLRTPLTSVKGYVSMVLDGDAGKITQLQRKLLMQSFISSQRMVYLISDLLNVSRLKTGKFVIEPVPSNLAKVIQEEVDQLAETVKGRHLILTYHRPEHFPILMLDETKLRQVIMNFIDNAVYYTPSGGHIEINLLDKPGSVEFTVTDDGMGVPRHEQHHLFTKFYRAPNAKRARPDGTGLGLFMAKKVIVAQGGAVVFKSQEGRGSTFGFTFAKHLLLGHEPHIPAPQKP
jgi:signal transduction histidine kinase